MTSELKLGGEYYAESQTVFKAATDQNEHMLAALAKECADLQVLDILSVGSGSGLFELPMLKALSHTGQRVRRFIGVDPDASASQKLATALGQDFGAIEHQIVASPFEEFTLERPVDLIVYNHVFEYFQEGQDKVLRRSLGMLSPSGRLLLFSPLRGGINQLYEDNMQEYFGYRPIFSEDISRLLEAEGFDYVKKSIDAACDISLLKDLDAAGDGMKLLSFLAQIDCRALTTEKAESSANYFKSLAAKNLVPHPTDLFILR